MSRITVRCLTIRICLTVLFASFLATLLTHSRSRITSYFRRCQRPRNLSHVTDRCYAVRRICDQPHPNGSLNADELVKELAPVCQQTASLDPMDLLELCSHEGRRPQLVSNKFTSERDTCREQGLLQQVGLKALDCIEPYSPYRTQILRTCPVRDPGCDESEIFCNELFGICWSRKNHELFPSS